MKTLGISWKSLIDFSPGCNGVYCMKYQHGSTFVWSWLCSNLHMYDIDLHCMPGSYVQVWVLYHMDLRCILVAMFVYLSHGSTLHWYTTMMKTHFAHESRVLMYCRCLVDDLWSSWFLPRSDNLLFQNSRLSYPSSLMLWGAFCYT